MTELYKLLNSSSSWDSYFSKVAGYSPDETAYTIKWQTVTRQAHYRKAMAFSLANDDYFYAPLYCHSNTTFSGGIFIYIKAGGYYYLVGLYGDTGDSLAYLSYSKQSSIDISSISPNKTSKSFSLSTPAWFAVGFRKNSSSLDIIFNSVSSYDTELHEYPPSGTWTSYGSITLASDIVTEFGFCSIDFAGAGTSNYSAIKYIHLDYTDLSSNIGGSVNLSNILYMEFISAVNGGGGGIVTCRYSASDLSTLKQNLQNYIFYYNNVNGNILFHGYVSSYRIDRDTITFIFEEDLRRLSESLCNYNAIKMMTDIMRVEASYIGDPYAPYTVDEYKDKFLTVIKNDLFTTYAYVSQTPSFSRISVWDDNDADRVYVSFTPDATEGYYYNLYYNIDTLSNHYAMCHKDASAVQTNFTLRGYMKQSTAFRTVKLILSVSTRCRADSYIYGMANKWRPTLRVWDYIDDMWVTFEVLTEEKYSTAEDTDTWNFGYLQEGASWETKKAPKLTVDLDLLIAYYMTKSSLLTADDFKSRFMNFDESSISESGFIPFEMKMHLDTGYSIISMNNGIEFYSFKVRFDGLTIAQSGEVDSAEITGNTTSTITVDTSPADVNNDFPLSDGIVEMDVAMITESYKDAIDNIFSNDSDWSVNNGLTTDDMVVKIDVSALSKFDFLAKVCNLHNGIFYSESTELEHVATVDLSPSSSGYTITQDDIVSYDNNEWSLTVNSDNIAEKIVVRGAVDTITLEAGVDYIVDKSNSISPKEIVIEDKELDTYREVLRRARTFVYPASNYMVNMNIIIDLSRTDVDYESIVPGKTVAVQLPSSSDTHICDYSGDDELLIEKMSVREVDGRQFATLFLSRRYV